MPRERGISLIENIAALALVGLAVMVLTSITAVAPQTRERVEAQRAMLRTAEAALEAVRAEALPLVSGPAEVDMTVSRPVSVRLEVSPVGGSGLWRVEAVARAEVRGQRLERRLLTQVWRPS